MFGYHGYSVIVFFEINWTLTHLYVGFPDGGEDDLAEALATCVVSLKLRRVEMWWLPPRPVIKALTIREVPLEELEIMFPPWVC